MAEVSAATMNSPRAGAIWVLAGRLAVELDARLVEAINARWGMDWCTDDLKGRLQRFVPAGTMREAWILDGKALVDFGEPVLSQQGSVYTLTRSCITYKLAEA